MKYIVATAAIIAVLAPVAQPRIEVKPPVQQPSLSVRPVDVDSFAKLREPLDIQPVTIPDVLQSTYNPQQAGAFGLAQPAARAGVYQKTTNPQE